MNFDSTFSFTQKRINAIKADNKSRTYSDKKQPNLKLTVTEKGTKTYFARFKVSSKSHNIRVGDASSMSLDDARSRVVELLNSYRLQAHSALDSLTNNRQLRLNDIFELYKIGELDYRNTIAGRTHGLEIAYRKHVQPVLGDVLIEELSKKFVRVFFKELECKGYCIHNKCLSVLRECLCREPTASCFRCSCMHG
ncbi:hypothetical protein C2869_19600 [Saccharobesus litoralis]|uniref:Integrase DNA-binding domain-containing protein n=1 Tax=Saccharobesus litoralis TaxID=2172099 RepID=A0A2S0VW84_9ALTE|nr:Arm DNA-binding domain-containing protein [Saccharobesus litoralis]AWB68471.1 hypothetical protein C2869_19600 [Saccharobesus litoralis]